MWLRRDPHQLTDRLKPLAVSVCASPTIFPRCRKRPPQTIKKNHQLSFPRGHCRSFYLVNVAFVAETEVPARVYIGGRLADPAWPHSTALTTTTIDIAISASDEGHLFAGRLSVFFIGQHIICPLTWATTLTSTLAWPEPHHHNGQPGALVQRPEASPLPKGGWRRCLHHTRLPFWTQDRSPAFQHAAPPISGRCRR